MIFVIVVFKENWRQQTSTTRVASTNKYQKLSEEERRHYHKHIHLWELSNLSQAAYCASNNLNLNTFSYQRQEILKERKHTAKQISDKALTPFVEVVSKPPVTMKPKQETNSELSLQFTNGIILKFSSETAVAKILCYVTALKEI